MNVHTRLAIVVGSFLIAGCSAGTSLSPGSSKATVQQSATMTAIAAVDALGSSVGTVDNYNEVADSPTPAPAQPRGLGGTTSQAQCKNYHEFFAPDRHGDKNSTESLTFYDAQCTQLERDAVRIYTPTGSSSETVDRSVLFYAFGSSTASASLKAKSAIENATFGNYGFPKTQDGFDSAGTSKLALSGANTVTSGHEMVLKPASGNTNDFCGDSAGFNVNGIPPTNEVLGWQGGVLDGGTRTKNSDGSITWSSTRTGTANQGKPNAFSIHSGTENTACPITVPMWTLTGGTPVGPYSIPTTATYLHGILQSLSIQNATLPNGSSLNVSTNPSQPFTSSTFITGTISTTGSSIATFGVNAFGNGTLTISSTGKQYVITDWQVVK